MSQVSPTLRKTNRGYCYYCPGCESIHCVNVGGASGPQWTFNGDIYLPSFSPSVRHFEPAWEEDGVKYPEKTFCHYFITAGEIKYCGDCTHKLNGQTVLLPPLPAKYSDDNYGWPE